MPNTCSKCSSINLVYDHTHGFWQCQQCGNTWAYGVDDPDYDDDDFDYDGDTGRVFINGTWVVVSPRQNEKFLNN